MSNRDRAAVAFTCVMLVGAAFLVILLARQNRLLRETKQRLTDRILYPYAGLFVPEARVESLAGDTVVIGSGTTGRPQLLFFFTTSCQYCKESIPIWNSLADSVAAGTPPVAMVYGVSLSSKDSTRAFMRDHPVRFPVVTMLGPRMRYLYRARAVPVTVVLGSDGRYSFSSLGVITSSATVDSLLRAARQPSMVARQ
jgi:peroxiredoxin